MELLISSNICRYAEFRAVDRVTTLIDNEIRGVPCSRADVFTTKDVNVVEKRLLMKVLSNCMNYKEGCEEFKGMSCVFELTRLVLTRIQFNYEIDFGDKTFRSYLEARRLTPKLVHYVLYAISMSDDSTLCLDGVKNTKKFLSSLGRYGNTPFLFPMYGCGEIPQCFCRLCAVFGGVYCLKRSLEEIHFSESDDGEKVFKAIKCDKQTISAKNLVVANARNLLKSSSANESEAPRCGRLSRAIFITNQPLGDASLSSGGGGVNFMKMCHRIDDTSRHAFVIQLTQPSGTCPRDLCKIIFCLISSRNSIDFLIFQI